MKKSPKDSSLQQSDLVLKTGLTFSSISRYVAGSGEPRLDSANKLAAALDVSTTWLWGYDVEKARNPEQKKEEAIYSVVTKIREEPDFFNVVSQLAGLDVDAYVAVKHMISVLTH